MSFLIRNLRKPSDYSKAVLAQDELMRIAISNDANIAASRSGLKQGIIPSLPPQQLKSPSELQSDLALQEQTGLNNLLRLFAYREASDVITKLNSDELFTLNQTFPEIEREINKRFAKGLMSPSFFIDYLKKFKEELEASKGLSTNLSTITNKFNNLTDNINDIRSILPTRNQFSNLQDFVESEIDNLPRIIILPLLERIQRLEKSIPSREDLEAISQDTESRQSDIINMIQNITSDIPTQYQLNTIIEDIRSSRITKAEGVQRIENSLSGITDSQLDMLDEIKRGRIKSDKSEGKIIASVIVGTKLVPSLGLIESPQSKSQSIYIIDAIMGNKKLTANELKSITKSDPDFGNWYNRNIGNTITLTNLKDYILKNSLQELPEFQSSFQSSPTFLDPTSKEAFSTEKIGFGLKTKKTLLKKALPKGGGRGGPPSIISDGIKYNREPTYKQFGKYVINMNQLKDRDILNVKFPSLGRIPQFKPTPVSDIMKEFILELLDTGKVSNRIYEQIPIDERQLFEKIATGAGILNLLKIKRTISNEDKEDNNRFTLLKGEYLAGNNSMALLKELRKLVVKFMQQGKISKHDGTNLLIELS